MERDEFVEELGIIGEQQYNDDGDLIVSLDEDSWAKAQVILDNSDLVDESEESSSISYEQSNLQYENDYFILNLIADFQGDEYRLVVKNR